MMITLPTPEKRGKLSFWRNLPGCAASLAIATLVKSESAPVIVLNARPQGYAPLVNELALFSGVSPLVFPDWETLPYDHVSPHQDICSTRMATLSALPDLTVGLVVMDVASLALPVAPRDYIMSQVLRLSVAEEMQFEDIQKRLQDAAYSRVNRVMEHGEYAVRGEIVDVFPMGYPHALRLEFFFDTLEHIRHFNTETQTSTEEVEAVNILPSREYSLEPDSIQRFVKNWEKSGAARDNALLQSVERGLSPAGIEYYLPWFFESVGKVWEYFPQNAHIVVLGDFNTALDTVCSDFQRRFEQVSASRPLLPPEQFLHPQDQIFGGIKPFAQIRISNQGAGNAGNIDFGASAAPVLTINHKFKDPLVNLMRFLDTFTGKVLFVIDSAARRGLLTDLLHRRNIRLSESESVDAFWQSEAPYGVIKGFISQGALLHSEQTVAIIGEQELFGGQTTVATEPTTRKPETPADQLIRNLVELQLDDPVVHTEHGVGRYRGLQTLDAGGVVSEYMVLEYVGDDRLYVPVADLDYVHRYAGVEKDLAPWHRLGGKKWDTATKRARERAYDAAAKLLEIYARRESSHGVGIDEPDEQFRIFGSEFPFELTPDQDSAITAIVGDMRSDKPMDRLVCGDVGFGKTEVAMRAAFLAVSNSRQVAILAPTTLLAQQHHETFSERFDGWPVNIALLSRFQSEAEIRSIRDQLKTGAVDMVIGTHRLLSKDIGFKNLGLLIIDEEHRFGVQHKEKFKSLRANVDILALTATPIPRTLHLSLSGIRDLSIIATPPKSRVAIKTELGEWEDDLIIEACQREMRRGGQVYMLHNKVKTIHQVVKAVQELLPQSRVAVAHGQMHEQELEHVMRDFYHQQHDILVCTTIIENGIDVPTANTIIINRADRLGLAQLYQLRGRVGRSHHRAYAYLLVEDIGSLAEPARKRLDAIAAIEELGFGFTLAMQDMEIRGAGELLGEEQSGQMQEIGFEMFSTMLHQAVDDLRHGHDGSIAPVGATMEVELEGAALIPEAYLPDVNARLVFYKRIAGCSDDDALDNVRIELYDRFGKPPEAVENLFIAARLKLRYAGMGVTKLVIDDEGGLLEFSEHARIDAMKMIALIQSAPKTYQLKGATTLMIKVLDEDKLEVLERVLREVEG
jgi:transcription-repair coupling factor (superfamily II helicase)